MAKKDNEKKVKRAAGAAVVATAAGTAYAAKKKNKKLLVTMLVLLVIAVIVGVMIFGYYQGWFDGILHPETQDPGNNGGSGSGGGGSGSGSGSGTGTGSGTGSGSGSGTGSGSGSGDGGDGKTVADMSIYFLELGNQYTGDCVYIKAGDVDILIDAGSRGASAATICKFVDQYCEDGVLEYVIATHAHQDHIEGFVGTKAAKGVLDYYKVETLIMYARKKTTSNVSADFAAKVEEIQAKGTNAYTAEE